MACRANNCGLCVDARKLYKEIVENVAIKDQLSKWVKNRKEKGLCIKPTPHVTRHVQSVADYVWSRYDSAHAWKFFESADAWLIAHAMHSNGTVVTHESNFRPDAKKARIPDVCRNFEVSCVNLYKMLEMLKAKI